MDTPRNRSPITGRSNADSEASHSLRRKYITRVAVPGAILLAIAIAVLQFRHSLSVPIIHDAFGYYRIAKEIWRNGAFSQYELSDLRTYAYPLFLGAILHVALYISIWNSHVNLLYVERSLVFAAQLSLHIVATLLLRYALRRLNIHRNRIVDLIFVVVLLNPFLLIYPPYMLTESVSFSLCISALSAIVILLAGSANEVLLAALTGFGCGVMIALRPANIYVLVPLAIALVGVVRCKQLSFPKGIQAGVIAMACITGPLLPQLRNNIVYYKMFTPLVVDPVKHPGHYMGSGILWIKNATSIVPGSEPSIVYLNPFVIDSQVAMSDPVRWYRSHPARGLTTICLHAFNLLDQDLPFPYNTTVTPWYYPAVSVLNLAAIALGIIGIVLSVRAPSTSAQKWLVRVAVGMLITDIGLHSLFTVETRYGVSALWILYGFAGIAGYWTIRMASSRQRAAALLFIATVTLFGSRLSYWVRAQSPVIVKSTQNAGTREGHRSNPYLSR